MQVKYELQAVVTHHGLTCTTGHYTAVVKHDDNWLMCDDKQVGLYTV